MKNYIYIQAKTDTKWEEDTKRLFGNLFDVDLDNGAWESIINKCFRNRVESIIDELNLPESIKTFADTVNEMLKQLISIENAIYNIKNGIKIIRTSSAQDKLIDALNEEFINTISHLREIPYFYDVYEPDIVLKYELWTELGRANSAVGKTGDFVSEAYLYDEARCGEDITYQIPFETDVIGFCENYRSIMLSRKTNAMFMLAQVPCGCENHGEDFNYYEEKISYINSKNPLCSIIPVEACIDFKSNERYGRWSRNKIEKIESELGNNTADAVLYQESVNASLLRNTLDNLIINDSLFSAEALIPIFDKLSLMQSLYLQNVLGCIIMQLISYKDLFLANGHRDAIECLIFEWFDGIDKYNKILEILVRGYTYKRDRCNDTLMDLNEALDLVRKNPINFETEKKQKLMDVEWEKDKAFKYQVADENNHSQAYWVYAILQRHLINRMTPYVKKKAIKDHYDWQGLISYMALMYRNIDERERREKNEINSFLETCNTLDCECTFGMGDIKEVLLCRLKKKMDSFDKKRLDEWYDIYIINMCNNVLATYKRATKKSDN